MKERKTKYRATDDALTKAAPAPRRKGKKSARGLVLIVALAALAAAVARPACVERLGDVPLRLASAIEGHKAPPEIAIVAIDDRSMEELGSWPWPRATFIGVLERLRQMDAGLIVIDANVASDVGISEMRLPVRNDGGPDYVVGYDFYPTLSTIPPDTKAEAMDRELREAADKLAFPSTPSDDSPIPAMAGIRINRFPAPDRLYLREGFGNLFPDPDGRVRSQQLAARLRHRAYPSLALAAAAKWRGFTPILAQDAEGRPSGVVLGEERINTKSDARLAINFRGRAGTFEAISAADVASGKAPRESIEGRLLLVGLYSPMLKASHPTPFGTMTDVEILANSVDNILFDRGMISYAGMATRIAAFAAMALLYALLFVKLSPRWQAAATILVVAGLSLCATAGIALKRVVIPAAFPAAGAILLYLTMTFWRLVRHEAPRLILRRALKGRARDADIEAIAADASILSGPARAASVTAMAIDIKGFRTIVEQLPPSSLAEFMKDYRALVSECSTEQGGFVESFSGDECSVVFGSPLRRTEHAQAALSAATKLRRQLYGRSDEMEAKFGASRIRLGIGIHSGIAAAGDTGAGGPGFGFAGPALEAAAQLRAANRAYRTSTLVGDATRAATEAGYSYRALDPVSLCGEGSPSVIHELVGEFGTILPQLGDFLEAREAYLQGDFRAAARMFAAILERNPHDGPSQLFMRRSMHLAENPPQGGWSGVWR